jgi:hypothetical protein
MVIWLFGTSSAREATAQDRLWDLAPYQIRVTIAVDAPGQLQDQIVSRLPTYLEQRVGVSIGPLWRLRIDVASGAERSNLLRGRLDLPADRDEEDQSALDKSLSLIVRRAVAGFVLRAREYDHYVERHSAIHEMTCAQYAAVNEAAFILLHRAFSPLAQFEVDGEDENRVKLSLRGAAVPGPASATPWTRPGDVFLPIFRRTSREGEVLEEGIQPVPWTVLTVEPPTDSKATSESAGDGALVGRIHSGTRRPFGVRRRGRIEQIAIALKPGTGETALKLVSRTDEAKPLAGYAVFQEVGSDQFTQLGTTDDDGRIEVPPAQTPVQMVVIKHGNQLLAKLPVVPGAQELIEVPLPDDGPRLEAEATMTAMREELIDLVARRTILIARARHLIESEGFERATELVDELDSLPGRVQFNRELDRQEQLHRSADPQVQKRIKDLFDETRVLLGAFLDTRPVSELRNKLVEAKSGG